MTDAPSTPSNAEPRIVSSPDICGGRPRINGTRLRVVDVIDMLASGMTEEDITRDYPYVSREDIGACLKYVRRFADHPTLGNTG